MGDITFDFSGTSSQVKGPFNCVPSGSLSAACYAIRVLTGSEIPTNGGCFWVDFFKASRRVNCQSNRASTCKCEDFNYKRISGCMVSAFKCYEKIPADPASEMLILQFGGKHRNGNHFVVGELIASGSGAGVQSDGVDVIETDASNCMNLPVEVRIGGAYKSSSFLFETRLRGAGQSRGGLGVSREYEILEGEIKFTHRGEALLQCARL